MVEEELFKKKRMESFSGCFDYGMPQQIYDRWVAEDKDGGRFKRVGGTACQHAGLLISLYAGVFAWDRDRADAVVGEMIRAEGFSINNGEADRLYRWFGMRVRWRGTEASRFCQVIYKLSRDFELEMVCAE
jgi:hypothetical protein